MIKRLQIKFVLTSMFALFFLILSIFYGSYLYMQNSSENEINEFLDLLISQDGDMAGVIVQTDDEVLQQNIASESTTPLKWFSVKYNENDELVGANYAYSTLDEESVYQYSIIALEYGDDSGTIQGLQFKIVEKDYGKLIVFVDRRIQTEILENFLEFIYLVTGISFLLLLLLTIYLSKLMLKPVKETLQKQKTFIADSGHELKTPLTIISANVQMLDQEMGENKYSCEIKNQLQRMNKLMDGLLMLAKTEIIQEKNKTMFDFSKLVEDSILQFEIVAYEANQVLTADIIKNRNYYGVKDDIQMLCNILLDNATKYAVDGSEIKVKLHEHNRKSILEITNTCNTIEEGHIERIFERFYKLDKSRTRENGGYGIGLSIARNIVENHHGKISAKINNKTEMIITVIL